MKKEILVLFVLLLNINFVLAAECNLAATLVNQDPYPAVQGDYVKLVFQLNGVNDPECGIVTFSLLEKYPIIFDPGSQETITVNSGTFTKNNPSFLMIPYKVRVDENAVNGENPIEVSFSKKVGTPQSASFLKEFNLEVKDVRADFEVLVNNYDTITNILTLEVLNIGKSDVKALTLEIPKQDNIEIKGSNTNILGDIDSNDYTTSDFEATSEGGNINLNIKYTDETGARRELSKTVYFDPISFDNRKANQKSIPYISYTIFAIIVLGVIYLFYRRHRKKHHSVKR